MLSPQLLSLFASWCSFNRCAHSARPFYMVYWVVGWLVPFSGALDQFESFCRSFGLHFRGSGVCILRVVGIPWRVYFWFPFLGAQRSNFEGSGCPLGSNSERSGRPLGLNFELPWATWAALCDTWAPKEPKAKFSQISPLPCWSHFGIIFRTKSRYKIRAIFGAQNELKMESQGGA